MLRCICSVIDHRWCQNVVRAKKWHTRRSRMCHWCSYHILTSSLLWSVTEQLQDNMESNLFHIIKNKLRKKKLFIFLNLSICCLYNMKQSHWLLCIAKNCDWSREIIPLSKWLSNLTLWNENSHRKQKWTAKSTSLKENAGKVKSVFVIRAALWAEKLGHCLEYCRSLKNTLGKLVVAGNLKAIWFEFWKKRALVTVRKIWWKFLSSVISDSQISSYSVGDTFWLHCSWPWAVVSHTLLAAVPWSGLEHSYWKAR